MDHRFPVTVEAPEDWGDTVVEVAQRLSKELNNEEDPYIAINNKVIRRVHIEGAIVKARSVN